MKIKTAIALIIVQLAEVNVSVNILETLQLSSRDCINNTELSSISIHIHGNGDVVKWDSSPRHYHHEHCSNSVNRLWGLNRTSHFLANIIDGWYNLHTISINVEIAK